MADYFTITRTLRAPRELVFEAITKPEHFAVWFGTAAVEVPQESLTMDVRPGGAFRAVMQLPDGNRIDWAGSYVAVEPPAHLAMTLTRSARRRCRSPRAVRPRGGRRRHAAHDPPGPRRLLRRAGRGDDRGLQRVHRRHRARGRAAADGLIAAPAVTGRPRGGARSSRARFPRGRSRSGDAPPSGGDDVARRERVAGTRGVEHVRHALHRDLAALAVRAARRRDRRRA